MAPATTVNHPAGRFRRPLITLRSLQVLVSALSTLGGAYMVFVFGHAHRVIASDKSHLGVQLTSVFAAMVAVSAVSLLLGLASLVCSIIFLTYTISPKARAASCGGNSRCCITHTSDLGYDCFWAVLWGATFILNVLSSYRNSTGVAIASVAFSLAMFVLYVATAVLSAKVRGAVSSAAAQAGSGGDIEAGAVGPVVGVVATDVYCAPAGTVGGVPVVAAAEAGALKATVGTPVAAKV